MSDTENLRLLLAEQLMHRTRPELRKLARGIGLDEDSALSWDAFRLVCWVARRPAALRKVVTKESSVVLDRLQRGLRNREAAVSTTTSPRLGRAAYPTEGGLGPMSPDNPVGVATKFTLDMAPHCASCGAKGVPTARRPGRYRCLSCDAPDWEEP